VVREQDQTLYLFLITEGRGRFSVGRDVKHP
jgi:hypothetical protein